MSKSRSRRRFKLDRAASSWAKINSATKAGPVSVKKADRVTEVPALTPAQLREVIAAGNAKRKKKFGGLSI